MAAGTYQFEGWAITLQNELGAPPPKDAQARLALVTTRLGQLPNPPREVFKLMFFAGVDVMALQTLEWQRRDRIYAMVFGLATLVFLASVAITIPNPQPFALFTFRLIASLGAGGVGAFLPGSLSVTVKRPSFVLRATGAIALAALVYLVNPPALAQQ